jgi:hypothetical protein
MQKKIIKIEKKFEKVKNVTDPSPFFIWAQEKTFVRPQSTVGLRGALGSHEEHFLASHTQPGHQPAGQPAIQPSHKGHAGVRK